ncbi:MBL fold metallo-hydrolase, partial [cyanobacterium TDX16]
VTHVGGPTVVLELDGWRILTDPTFDAPGGTYGFGWGTSSKKTGAPAVAAEDVGPVDLVLLSHDHHADNLDVRGRALLDEAPKVLTTRPGARRLALPSVQGLRPGEVVHLDHPDRPTLRVRATPCRHGPPLSRPIAGAVVGFELQTEDRPGSVWMTGDTVLHRSLRRTAAELGVDVLLAHLGQVQFGFTGPLRYSMSSEDAIELVELTRPRVVVPVHYEGWSHFSEPVEHARATFARAAERSSTTTCWLEPGVPTSV